MSSTIFAVKSGLVLLLLVYFAETMTAQDVPNHSDCPDYNQQSKVVHLPKPGNCQNFYICDAAKTAVQLECPDGLHYNAKESVCDWPESAKCA